MEISWYIMYDFRVASSLSYRAEGREGIMVVVIRGVSDINSLRFFLRKQTFHVSSPL